MKTLAALILALLLAVMGYGIFWMICLDYTTDQMKGAVKEALQADITYATPQWVPDYSQVTMDLPAAHLVMEKGPIREIAAPSLRLETSFLMRDRWTMRLPSLVEVTLANGKKLLLETQGGEVLWLREGSRLTLRADSLRLLDMSSNELAKLDDILLERKNSDTGVRLNLASRPQMTNGKAVLTGQMVMPYAAFGAVVNLFGGEDLPSGQLIMRTIAESMKRYGGTLELDNVTFTLPNGGKGAIFGKIQVLADGRMTGSVALTADSPVRVLGWIQQGGLLVPRISAEKVGAQRFTNGLIRTKATVRAENMQETLMLNGQPVGALPNALSVVSRLWQ